MTDSAIIAIAAAISIAFSTIGPAMGQGKTAAAAMESIARQPDAAGDIRSSLIISYRRLRSTRMAFSRFSHHLRPADRLYARRQGLRGAQL